MESPASSKKERLEDWVVVILCTIIYFLQVGLQRTGTLMFVACMDRYNVNREKASIPFMVCYITSCISGPFIGYLGNRFQLRSIVIVGNVLAAVGVIVNFWAEDIIFVTFFWGIIGGLGMSVTYSLNLEFLNRHFDKHLSTACGIYYAGSSVGATVLPYLSNALLDYYGLSGTFLILGGLLLNAICASLALPVYPKTSNPNQVVNQNEETDFKDLNSTSKDIFYITQSPQIIGEEDKVKSIGVIRTIFRRGCHTINRLSKTKQQSIDQKSGSSPFAIFLNPIFLALAIVQSCFACIISTLNVMLVDYCFEKGITSDQGVYVVMVVSITDIVGRLGLGWITDYGFVTASNFLVGSYVLLGVSCVMYVWSNGFIMCIVSSVLYGAIFGAVSTYSPKMFKDHIALEHRTMAVASRNFFFTPVAIALPNILGYYKDISKSYDGLMYIFIVLSLLASVLTWAVPRLAKRQLKCKNSSDQRF